MSTNPWWFITKFKPDHLSDLTYNLNKLALELGNYVGAKSGKGLTSPEIDHLKELLTQMREILKEITELMEE